MQASSVKRERRRRALSLMSAMLKIAEPIMVPVNTYSSIMRDLNKNFPEKREIFMKAFKDAFDSALINDIDDAEDKALMEALSCIDKVSLASSYIDHYMVKKGAAIVQLGSPEVAAKYISHVIKFIMLRVPQAEREHAMSILKNKVLDLNSNEISTKKTPETASFGQALTFIKTILNGHNPAYIRSVIEHVVRGLS